MAMTFLRFGLVGAAFIIISAFPMRSTGAQPNPTTSSDAAAINRVAIFYQHSEYQNVQRIMEGLTKRIQDAFAAEPGLSVIEASHSYGETSAQVRAHCEKAHVNAFVYPHYLFSVDEKTASVIAILRVIDCYGVPFYGKSEMKSESRLFVNRSGEREITDMGNHLVDLLLADFRAYKIAHAAKWQNLLKFGIAADPPNGAVGLFVAVFLQFPRDGKQPVTASIDYLRPDGRGAKAGLKEGDVIVSIDGVPPDIKAKSGMQIAEQMETAHTVVVRRGAQDVTISLPSAASVQR